MEQHVELQRRFLEVDEAKDPEATALESYIASISGPDTGVGWADIFAAKESVVILGESGSGKSDEMQAQMARLRPANTLNILIAARSFLDTPMHFNGHIERKLTFLDLEREIHEICPLSDSRFP